MKTDSATNQTSVVVQCIRCQRTFPSPRPHKVRSPSGAEIPCDKAEGLGPAGWQETVVVPHPAPEKEAARARRQSFSRGREWGVWLTRVSTANALEQVRRASELQILIAGWHAEHTLSQPRPEIVQALRARMAEVRQRGDVPPLDRILSAGADAVESGELDMICPHLTLEEIRHALEELSDARKHLHTIVPLEAVERWLRARTLVTLGRPSRGTEPTQITAQTVRAEPLEGPVGDKRMAVLRLDQIEADPDNERDVVDAEDLRASMAHKGLQEPIIVYPIGPDRYRLQSGHRRLCAARSLNWETIPAIISEAPADKRDQAVRRLVSNVRLDPDPIMQARTYRFLTTEGGMSQRELAEEIGTTQTRISMAIRLLELDTGVLEFLQSRQLSTGHAEQLLRIKIDQLDYRGRFERSPADTQRQSPRSRRGRGSRRNL